MNELYYGINEQGYIVTDVPSNPLLNTLGVFKGARIIKKTTYKFGGPALIMISSREVAIGKDLATQISIEKYEK